METGSSTGGEPLGRFAIATSLESRTGRSPSEYAESLNSNSESVNLVTPCAPIYSSGFEAINQRVEPSALNLPVAPIFCAMEGEICHQPVEGSSRQIIWRYRDTAKIRSSNEAAFATDEALLRKDSAFFDGFLGQIPRTKDNKYLVLWAEGIEEDHLAFYLEMIHRDHSVNGFKLRHSDLGESRCLMKTLILYNMSVRVRNERMADIAREGLIHRTRICSPEKWQEWFLTKPVTFVKGWITSLQACFYFAEENDIPLAGHMVRACSGMPAVVFALYFPMLYGGFATRVAIDFAARRIG